MWSFDFEMRFPMETYFWRRNRVSWRYCCTILLLPYVDDDDADGGKEEEDVGEANNFVSKLFAGAS